MESKKSKDWEKTERLYRKAAKLDFDINLSQLLNELEEAKKAEKAAQEAEIKAKLKKIEEIAKAEEARKLAESIANAKKLHEQNLRKMEQRKGIVTS